MSYDPTFVIVRKFNHRMYTNNLHVLGLIQIYAQAKDECKLQSDWLLITTLSNKHSLSNNNT